MEQKSTINYVVLGLCIFLGLSSLGYLVSNAALEYKQLDRSVTVKGLSEREYEADIVIWPIKLSVVDNDLENLYASIDKNRLKVEQFLEKNGIKKEEITFSIPSIFDKSAQQYSNNTPTQFRYTGTQTITVYSKDITSVRNTQTTLSELGKEGIVLVSNSYDTQTEYIFTRLNDIKPQMVEEATKEARMTAQKFAEDSESTLGKIKKASQGQFSISQRDKNNPHIKKIRVVSTVQYYLSD